MSTNLDRPRRRVYVWDEQKQEFIDQRVADRASAMDGIIFRSRVYNNLGPVPIFVESRSQLKSILKYRGLVEAG